MSDILDFSSSMAGSCLLCQVCGTRNFEDQEYCRRCQHKLLVLSGPFFEEDTQFEQPVPEEGFSFDEHLLERISALEEVIKRTAETLRQFLFALRKQEKNVLINHTGLTTLRDLLEERGVVTREEWSQLWETRMDSHLLAMDKRERFLALRDHIAGLYEGRKQREFEQLLDEAEHALSGYDVDAAVRALEGAFSLDPQNYELAFFLGETCFDEGKHEAALGYFARVLAIRPDHYEGLVYTGAIHYERGDYQRAESFLKRSVQVYPEAFLPYFSLGAVYAGRGDLKHAVFYLERAVAIDAVPQALYLLGNCLYEMGRLSAAIGVLQDAVRANPVFEEAHQLLGLAYLDRQWNRKALDALHQAERLSARRVGHRDLVRYLIGPGGSAQPPAGSEARRWFEKAEQHLDEDSPRQALSCYRKALSADPENPTVLMAYALLCLQLNRNQEIEALAKKVISLEPDEVLKTTAYATLIEALRGQGRYREGHSLSLRMLDEGSTDFTKTIAYFEMAYSLAEMEENLDEALDYARRSVELAPEELRQLPLAALGWVHYKRKEFAEAVDSLSESSELAPASSTLTHLSMALLAAGEKERARNVLARARRLQDHGEVLEEKMLECVRSNRGVLEQNQRSQKK